MDRARITVHPVARTGGRRVAAHVHGEDTILGTAYGLPDLAAFLRRIGVEDPDRLLSSGDPLVEWRGGGRDVWGAD
ncbi:hypothetical protein AB0953_17025 [Streptomyces sp. NPDC046866]|uniref:hypothetical protein n=1 Tax=Streptomyces sp. NPDC046866 TaxID=3154921 RepID=UPI00345359B7